MQSMVILGKIIKGIAGFYYVHVAGKGIYECKAKGVFRKNNEKPLVGDNVEIIILDEDKKLGNVENILPRQNDLIRPAVANVDQALVIFAADKPKPNYNLLDRFLLMMEQKEIPTIICFNKMDLVTDAEMDEMRRIYEGTGHPVFFMSAKKGLGVEEVKACLYGKTSTVAGPSGVGKSSFINLLQSGVRMETGSISEKIERGKHTTRHSELIALENDSYILDTPGFSSLSIFDLEKEDLKWYYPEFEKVQGQCRFLGCNHVNEPDCVIKQAVEAGDISTVRYENYKLLFEECSNRKKY
jgi:ribosome biogenesis GTPase